MHLIAFPVLTGDPDGVEPHRHVVWLEDIKEIIETGDGRTTIRLAGRETPLLIDLQCEQVMGIIYQKFKDIADHQKAQSTAPSPHILVPNGAVVRRSP